MYVTAALTSATGQELATSNYSFDDWPVNCPSGDGDGDDDDEAKQISTQTMRKCQTEQNANPRISQPGRRYPHKLGERDGLARLKQRYATRLSNTNQVGGGHGQARIWKWFCCVAGCLVFWLSAFKTETQNLNFVLFFCFVCLFAVVFPHTSNAQPAERVKVSWH